MKLTLIFSKKFLNYQSIATFLMWVIWLAIGFS